MSTITVDLERMLTSGKKNSYEGRAYAELVSCIARSKRVVCLTGAGISTSAGIPDFRSKDGLYKLASGSGGTLAPSTSSSRPSYTRSPSSSSSSSSTSSSRPSTSSSAAASSLKGADLFSTQVFSSAASLSRFYRFISSLNALSESAKPTPTHRFMRTLSQKGKLLRVYTQNIDGLEEKVGLTSANPSDFLSSGEAVATSTSSSKGKSKFQGDLVHLHGRAALVRCTVCTYTGKWTDEVSQAYEAGYSMPCSQCQERLTVRKALGKRLNVAVGSLRPAITLYGEQGTEDLFISEISNADVRSRPDCLIIFGTSLKVHGFKQLAKDFAREVEENDGKVIYVNLIEPGKDWNSSIHYHVQGHTDIFVEAVLNEWRHTRPQDFEKQSKLSLSDFQPTKEKHSKFSTSKDGKKNSDLPNVKKDTIKVNKDDHIARPVSPSKLRSSPVRRPRYEDDDDYIVSSVKSSKTDSSTKHPKQSLTAITSTPASELPSFKRISTSPTRAAIFSSDKKRKASTRTASDSDSCELRTEDEEEDHKLITRSSRTSSSHRTSAHGKHTIARKRTKLADKRTPRHSVRARDDFVISDSEQEGMDSNYDDIPLIAEMDSDDDEDTVYVQSSRTSSISKTAQRSLNKKSKSSAL